MKWCIVLDFIMNSLALTETDILQYSGTTSEEVIIIIIITITTIIIILTHISIIIIIFTHINSRFSYCVCNSAMPSYYREWLYWIGVK